MLLLVFLAAPSPALASTLASKGASADEAAEAPPPRLPSPLEIRVNLPAYRLDAILDDGVVASFPVTIGMPSEPTPDGRFVVDHVVWNPWWHPPAHRRPKDQVTPPGPRNPMGRVKLHFAADLYYLHGTAKTGEIGRATSRGCVRLRNEDALALAALVQEHAGPALSPGELARLSRNPGATRRLGLERPVRLHLMYEVAEVRDGRLALHDDVYGRYPGGTRLDAVIAALTASGVAEGEIDRDALAAVLAAPGATRPGQNVAVASLVRPSVAPAYPAPTRRAIALLPRE